MSLPPLMLATDLDGTLVGAAEPLSALNAELGRLGDRLMLVYVTGRSLPSVLGLIAAQNLLIPRYIIAGVGTSIHRGPAWEPDAQWDRRLARHWSAERVRASASFFPALIPQSPECQAPFKCSYFLPEEGASRTIASLQDTLRIQRVSARLIYSSGRDLDILPVRAGKGNALRYLATRLGVPMAAVLTCGDSGNDRDMLSLGGPAAVMANAQPELLASLPSGAYRCKAPFASGILEAMEHFGWLSDPAKRGPAWRGDRLLPEEA